LWKSIKKIVAVVAAVVVTYFAFQWGIVYFMNVQSAAIFGLTAGGFSYGAITGGLKGAIRGSLAAFSISSTIAGIGRISRIIVSGMRSVMEKALTLSEAVEHVAKWGIQQFTQLKTRQEMERFAKRNGMSLTELNFSLLGASFIGAGLGYDRLRIEDGDFGKLSEPGIRGFGINGVIGLPLDVVDASLIFQGIPSAQGINIAAQCRGQVTGKCLGGNYKGTLHGHSLGAAEVSVMKGMGMINKSVGITVHSLPFSRIAPGGVTVNQGSRDIVNLGILGHIMNYGSRLVDQSSFTIGDAATLTTHECRVGYASAGC
jgi:hypothetical protein